MRKTNLQTHQLNLSDFQDKSLLILDDDDPLRGRLSRAMEKKGFIVKKTPITMAKIIRRLNKNLKCETPKNLPIREIIMSEWWISE